MDWIKARLDCSSDHVWITLREQLRSDVNRWKELQSQQANNIEFNTDDRSFTISTRNVRNKQWVRLQYTGFSIEVHAGIGAATSPEERKHLYTFAPTVNANGECRLRSNGDEIEFWQASRITLEPLLFGEGHF
jgi:hypothetical protein